MKKLYLSITLLGMFILMFFITLFPTQAYTFNGSYDISLVDLDDSLNELNGASLNDLFNYDYLQTIPLIEYNGLRNKFELDGNEIVFNEYVYIDLGYKNLVNINNVLLKTFLTYGSGEEILESDIGWETTDKIFVNDDLNYTISGYFQLATGLRISYYDSDDNFLLQEQLGSLLTTTINPPNNTEYLRLSYRNTPTQPVGNLQVEEGSTATSYAPYGVLTEIYRLYTTPIQNTDITQSLFLYNLENMNIDLINYYFAVFLLYKFNLPVDDLWNQAFNAGESSGYIDGYNDGQYDWGILMPDGQTYFDPEDAQSYYFNEGRDDAIDNNFTLMGLVELIIGVVLSMVGWIINIEIFNISILGILSTLAVGIGIIWLLKLIRG